MAGKTRAVRPGDKVNYYEVRTTPSGGQYWIDTRDPTHGYLLDPNKNPDAIWYPIEYINWMLRGGPPTAQETRPAVTGEKARTLSGNALNGPIGVLYGERTTGASIFFGPRLYTAGVIVVGYGLGHGPSDSLQEVVWPKTNTGFSFNPGALFAAQFYPGDLAPSAADSFFVSSTGESAATFERYPGLTFVRAVISESGLWQRIGSGIPMPRFRWRGRKVRNYATGLDVWTDNPAYCMADYIISKQYGRGAKVNVQSVIDTAAEHDVLVLNTATGQNEKRHRLNIYMSRQASHKSIQDLMRAHCRTTIIERGGEFVFLYDKDKLPVMTFGVGDARPVSIDRLGGSGIPNQVTVSFPDPTKNDEMVPVVARTAEVEAGTAFVKDAPYELEGCVTNFHAASEAFYTLNTRMNNLMVVLRSVHPKAKKLEPNDIIEYTTDTFGMTSFKLRVLRVTRSGDGTSFIIECAGHDSAIYAFQMRAAETYPLPSLPDPFAPPSNVDQLLVSQRESRAYIAWQRVPDRDVVLYEIRRGSLTDSWGTAHFVASTAGTEWYDEPPIGTYLYFVKAVDANGQYSVVAATAQVTIFFYGVGFTTETVWPLNIDAVANYGGKDVDPYNSYPLGGAYSYLIHEGISVHGKQSVMLVRSPNADGGNPSLADAEITAAGYTSLQQWDDNKDAPRRTYNGDVQGIWAPLAFNGPTMSAYGGRGFPYISLFSDGVGWRNYDLKFNVPGIKRIGASDDGNINTRAFPVARYTEWTSRNPADTTGTALDVIQPSPLRVGQKGGGVIFFLSLSTNSPFAQTIFEFDYSDALHWQRANSYPYVMEPTDATTDVNGLVTLNYPLPMPLSYPPTEQVPNVSVQVLSGAASVSWAITALSRSSVTVKVTNSSTGAAAAGVPIRVTAIDGGAGGYYQLIIV